MKTSFRNSFRRDLKKIKDQTILDRVEEAIQQVEAADSLDEIAGLKKLSGADDCYRIRISDYRIGIVLEADEIAFARCLHRRDIYRSFP